VTLSILCHVNGPLRQNCYIVANDGGEALIVDPGSDGGVIAGILEENGWRALAIINTHGHFDHIGAVADLMERLNAPFYLHGGDIDMLRRANLYALVFGSRQPISVPEISVDLKNESTPVMIGDFSVEWIETPGHTPGGVCYIIEECLFSGDTILPGKMSQMKLPGANDEELAHSLRKLDDLSRDLLMHPGHGKPISLGEGLDKVRIRKASAV
jgi:hydroxyacylglutathione hydrolase